MSPVLTAQELVDDLAKAKLMGYLGRELSKLGRIDLLVLDELGYMIRQKIVLISFSNWC